MSDTNTREMVGIPPAVDTDAEDVAWALQTADALWKRNERVDAIVWLRRAAQAAGEAEDDDRALTLARGAAELAERLAHAPAGPPSGTPPSGEATGIDELLQRSQLDVEIEDRISIEAEPVSLRDAISVEAEPMSLRDANGALYLAAVSGSTDTIRVQISTHVSMYVRQ